MAYYVFTNIVHVERHFAETPKTFFVRIFRSFYFTFLKGHESSANGLQHIFECKQLPFHIVLLWIFHPRIHTFVYNCVRNAKKNCERKAQAQVIKITHSKQTNHFDTARRNTVRVNFFIIHCNQHRHQDFELGRMVIFFYSLFCYYSASSFSMGRIASKLSD